MAGALPAGCGARTGLDPGDLGDGALPKPDAGDEEICPDRQVNQLRLGAVRQMDLLFVVDSSASMADKQELLKDAVPPLVSRLVNPWCIDSATGDSVTAISPDAPCPEGYAREFKPLEDLHIGVITTSLGSHGGQVCTELSAKAGMTPDDHARLLPSVRVNLPSHQGLGFLSWDPERQQLPPGETDIATLEADFLSHVSAVGDRGCGFEAPLEAMYRFLIDPVPPAEVVQGECPTGGSGCSVPVGIDNLVLEQRKAFLRPDSVVAILILSDENDCSIIDGGQGWLVGLADSGGARLELPRATSACNIDPDSLCCRSCASAEPKPPQGCEPLSGDVECQKGNYAREEDEMNLRCFDQKRRFGFDLLYPTSRYVVGLQERTICPDSKYRDADCSCRHARQRALERGLPEPACTEAETGAPAPNPLYSNLSGYAAFARDPSQVFLAGIVGIPWQDLATPDTLADPTRLEYLTAQELRRKDPVTQASRWDELLGNPALGLSGDPFLIESVDPRNGSNPFTGQPIVPPSTTDPLATINGHEYTPVVRNNLQYTCIFPLNSSRDCTAAGASKLSCDCTEGLEDATNPLCQSPTGDTLPNHQYFAKAYPGRRLLEVLRDYGDNSITASICPKLTGGDSADLGLGYRPAVVSLVQRFRCASLDASFERDPESLDYGRVPCSVLAVSAPGSCDCSAAGRSVASGPPRDEVLRVLEQQGACGGATGTACADYCMCELAQLEGDPRESCQTESALGSAGTGVPSGWCYVDPAEGFGTSEVVASCPVGHERNVRVLGGATPRDGETLYSVCVPKCAQD